MANIIQFFKLRFILLESAIKLSIDIVPFIPCINRFLMYTVPRKAGHPVINYFEFHPISEEYFLQTLTLKHVLCAPEFPPKKVRNLNPKVLEQRRKGLENYIQELLKRKPVPKQLLTFLSLPGVSPSSSENSFNIEENRERSHQPVMMYSPNLYVEEDRNSLLPDIVGKGLSMAFYSSDEEID